MISFELRYRNFDSHSTVEHSIELALSLASTFKGSGQLCLPIVVFFENSGEIFSS